MSALADLQAKNALLQADVLWLATRLSAESIPFRHALSTPGRGVVGATRAQQVADAVDAELQRTAPMPGQETFDFAI